MEMGSGAQGKSMDLPPHISPFPPNFHPISPHFPPTSPQFSLGGIFHHCPPHCPITNEKLVFFCEHFSSQLPHFSTQHPKVSHISPPHFS